jgi:hypothetical protein
LGLIYKYDLNQNGRTENMIPLDHFLTSLIKTNGLKYRNLNRDIQSFYERQAMPGLAIRLGIFWTQIGNYGKYDFTSSSEKLNFETQSNLTDAGIKLSLRYAHLRPGTDARFGDGFGAKQIGKLPTLSVEYTMGRPGIIGSQFQYSKLKLRLEHRSKLNRLGYTDWILEGGKLWGKLPWPLLFTPAANQLVLNDKTAFNLLNYLEFVSDNYFTFFAEHHFEGLFLNYLPLVKKQKLREFVFFKLYAGSQSKDRIPQNLPMLNAISPMGKPYYEVGFGFENILKIARIDFVWRLNSDGKHGTYPFIVKPSFYFKF